MSSEFNFDTFKKTENLMEDEFPQLISTYKTATRSYMADIQAAHAAKNYREIELVAHALISSSVFLGLEEFAGTCKSIELSSRAQNKTQEQEDAISALIQSLPAMFVSIETFLKENAPK